MDKVLQALSTTIINESAKTFYQQILPIIPNIYFLKSPNPNYFDFINSITDSMLLGELKQIDLLELSIRLKNLLYYESNSSNQSIVFNQSLLMLWLVVSTSSDIVIKHKTNGNKMLLLSPENIIKANQTNQANNYQQTQIVDIGIIKYKTQISVLQMDRLTSELITNGSNVQIMDVIKNILTN
jgi:hypothetical protein